MAKQRFQRKDLETRYELFDKLAVKEYHNYYKKKIDRDDKAATQVNRWRATFAFLTGLFSVTAAFMLQIYFTGNGSCTASAPAGNCSSLETIIKLLVILSVVMPAFGAFFNSLSDLFQWNRTTTIYQEAKEALRIADALSPHKELPNEQYREQLLAFVEGALSVMNDETAQWGQAIRTPDQMQEFINVQREIARRVGGDANGNSTNPN